MRPTFVRLIIAVALLVLTVPLAVGAQPAGNIYRVGILGNKASDPAEAHLWQAFRLGLRERGWIEGRNILIEYRSAEGQSERLPGLAAELVRLKVDILVTEGTPPSVAAKNATKTIPIVFVPAADPVGSGLVASLARPGGNATGLSFLGPETVTKCLQLLKEVVPRITRAGVLSHPGNPSEATRKIILREAPDQRHGHGLLHLVARALAMQLQFLEARGPDDFESAFSQMRRAHVGGLTVLTSIMFFSERKRLVELAAKYKVPTVYPWREPVDTGGLLAYGPNLPDLVRRAAVYVDRILKGAKPGDLPIEQPTKFELIINLKTAKALGLTIPSSLLARADEVIQ